MVSVVVGGQQHFAQDSLAIAVRNPRVEVDRVVGNQTAESLQVLAETVNAAIPGLGIGRLGRRRPVAVREFRRFVFGVSAELQNVPLCDPHMFQNFPRRVGRTLGALAANLVGKVLNGVLESGVGMTALEELMEVLAESGVLRHGAENLLSFRAFEIPDGRIRNGREKML